MHKWLTEIINRALVVNFWLALSTYNTILAIDGIAKFIRFSKYSQY